MEGGVFMFNPGLKIGQIIKNADIVEIFKCGNMGGMRRSRTTNTLVIIQKVFIMISGLEGFYIIRAWAYGHGQIRQPRYSLGAECHIG